MNSARKGIICGRYQHRRIHNDCTAKDVDDEICRRNLGARTVKYIDRTGPTTMNFENPCGEIIMESNGYCTLEYPRLLIEDDSRVIKIKKKKKPRINFRRD
jgi:hypothetical protein